MQIKIYKNFIFQGTPKVISREKNWPSLINTKCKHTFRLMGPDGLATGLKKDSNL